MDIPKVLHSIWQLNWHFQFSLLPLIVSHHAVEFFFTL